MDPFVNLWFDLGELKTKGGWPELLVFLITDIILLTLDVGLDVSTSYEFYMNGEVNWAAVNFGLIFLPCVVRFATSTIEELKSERKGLDTIKQAWGRAVLCLPFFQTYRTIKRFIEMREQKVFQTSTKNMNSIREENANASICEGYLEAAPCQIFNIYVYLVTGTITQTQVGSICTSILTLSLTAEKVYFLYRAKNEKDVDPNWRLKLYLLLPMMLNISSNTILWSLLAANCKIGIVGCIFFVFTVNWGVIKCCHVEDTKQMYSTPSVVAVLSTWSPSCIGTGREMFRSLFISSYLSKLVIMAAFYLLKTFEVSFLPNPPLTSCISTSVNNSGSNSLTMCYNISDCFCGFDCENKKQKIR